MNKKTILSLLLACIIVFGGIALLKKSIKPIPSNTNGQADTNQRHTSEPMRQAPEIAPQTSQQKSSGINKCILAGKITYSDTGCELGSKNTTVNIEESAGIVSPDRETVNSTMRRIIAENKRNRVQEQNSSVASIETRRKISPFCDSYKSQIEYLDARARQGNTSSVTERIRQERWDVQKLQLAGNCYGNK